VMFAVTRIRTTKLRPSFKLSEITVKVHRSQVI
jgi:hypothetical protein